jgi:hypothetical protein
MSYGSEWKFLNETIHLLMEEKLSSLKIIHGEATKFVDSTNVFMS